MKKITLLLIILISFSGFSQTFDFTNTEDGFTEGSGLNITTGATFLTLTTKDNTTDGTLKNPTLKTTTAGVDTSVNTFIGVTLRNNSTEGPDYFRVSFPKDGSGRVYKNMDITTGDTEFVTYWIDLSNANWTGTMNEIQFHFKKAGNADYPLPDPQVTIDIDKVQFTASIPTTLKETFNFSTDDDTEGFTSTNGSISGPTSGVLTFTPAATKFAKLEQLVHHVNATTNKTITIVLKNNSAVNNQLRFINAGGTLTQEMSISDTEDKTYYFDLSGTPEWDGEQTFTIGIGTLEGTDAGKAGDDGTVEFKSIVIDNTTVLSNESFAKPSFTLYPNPARNTITVNSLNEISKITIFNLLGKKVLEKSKIKNVNVSSLNTGTYLVKIVDTKNNISTQKLIIN